MEIMENLSFLSFFSLALSRSLSPNKRLAFSLESCATTSLFYFFDPHPLFHAATRRAALPACMQRYWISIIIFNAEGN